MNKATNRRRTSSPDRARFGNEAVVAVKRSRAISRAAKKAVSGTGEWGKTNKNIQSGCANDCLYCYAKAMAVWPGRKTVENWKDEEIREYDLTHEVGKREGTIMFPTTHDITRGNIDHCVLVLMKMLKSGNSVLIVTKPSLEVVRRLCRELAQYKEQILFRFTIGSANNRVLKYWEPNAPRYSERMNSLKHVHSKGFATSVSCEPMLDAHIDRVVEDVRPFITHSVWLGMPNMMVQRVSLCTGRDEQAKDAARKVVALFSDEFITELYERYKDDPMVKWKDSIKQVVGIERPTEKGLDI